MKFRLSFFLKLLSVHVLMVCSGLVSGQVTDSLYLGKNTNDSLLHVLSNDSINAVLNSDSLFMPVLATDSLFQTLTEGKPHLDSIPSLPDSLLRKRFVTRLDDPLDTLPNRIFAYNVLRKHSYSRLQLEIDTTLRRFEINNPFMRKNTVCGYLGNLGLSYYPIGFEARKRPSDYPFLDNLSVYLHDPEATTYYQTKFPYTLIDFASAGPKRQNESTFSLLHTQNINKDWNVGLYYDTFSSIGQYINQNASVNGFSIFSAYRGNQYSNYSNFNWNNARMRENGGIKDLSTFDTKEDSSTGRNDASSYLVRSGVGKTIMLNRSFYMMHSYSPAKISFGRDNAENDSIEASRFALVHTLKYEWNIREYSDTASYALRGNPIWVDAQRRPATHDSIHFRRISNHLEILFREQSRNKLTAGFSVGLLAEMDRYNANMTPKTVVNIIESQTPSNSGWGGNLPTISGEKTTIYFRETNKYINTAVTGSFFNHTGRYLNWDINGKLYLTGYKLADTNIEGDVHLHYYTAKGRNTLSLGGSIDNVNPGYFLKSYVSNLTAWDNDFALSQEVRLRGEFTMPHRKLKLGAYLSQLNNYVYINREAIPQQASELLATGTVYIEKDIRWWKLGFRFRLYGQYSSNDAIIPLPAFAGFQSAYFEGWLVKNVLNMQLGWDVTYNTKYYAYAYTPATGMFYLQNEQKTGNYPFFDFFVNFQINRARIFIKTDGLNTVFSDYIGKGNFMAYRYPTNDFRMKFGVSWAFYD